jgi:hypothetical protein
MSLHTIDLLTLLSPIEFSTQPQLALSQPRVEMDQITEKAMSDAAKVM